MELPPPCSAPWFLYIQRWHFTDVANSHTIVSSFTSTNTSCNIQLHRWVSLPFLTVVAAAENLNSKTAWDIPWICSSAECGKKEYCEEISHCARMEVRGASVAKSVVGDSAPGPLRLRSVCRILKCVITTIYCIYNVTSWIITTQKYVHCMLIAVEERKCRTIIMM